MNGTNAPGPVAPRDPTARRPYVYIMNSQEVYGSPQPDGRGIQFIYEDGRFADCLRRVGHVTDESLLEIIPTTAGFRQVVHSIGVSVSEPSLAPVRFALQMYPANPGEPSTTIIKDMIANGDEQVINLDEADWHDEDALIGQIRFEFDRPGLLATVDVRLYFNDGYEAPVQVADEAIDFDGEGYRAMIARSLITTATDGRLGKVMQKAASGEDVTLAFIGGSVTQGAGATPIHLKSYARQCADAFAERFCGGSPDKVRLIKAGVGGTPSELGMIRFRRDVLRDGSEEPDVIVIEFAVNDAGDETGGTCFESLLRKALKLPWKPAVVLLFAVFSDDYNLQDRLMPVGERYGLPMVSLSDAVTPQFTLSPANGRIISKNQYFYDQFHPSNNGHRVMSDCLINLFEQAGKEAGAGPEGSGVTSNGHGAAAGENGAGQEDGGATQDAASLKAGDEPAGFPDGIAPVYGRDFEDIELLDRKEMPEGLKVEIKPGDFVLTDHALQAVEMDSEIEPVPEFPNNWAYEGGNPYTAPFVMWITCSKLVLVYKDSGDPKFGHAWINVDGVEVAMADPLVNGWNHCNPLIILNEEQTKEHFVQIYMETGHEDRYFTILGFGVVR